MAGKELLTSTEVWRGMNVFTVEKGNLRMSVKMLSRVMEMEISDPLTKLVLLVVADHYNDSEGCAWPSIDRICRVSGVSRRTVQRKLGDLEYANILERAKRYNDSDVYYLNLLGCHSDTCQSDTFGVSERHTNSYRTLNKDKKGEKKEVKNKTDLLEWSPSEKQKQFCSDKGIDPDETLAMIHDWAQNNPSKRFKIAPDAFWRNWIRNSRAPRGGKMVQASSGYYPKEHRTLTREMWDEATPALREHMKKTRPYHEWAKFEGK